MSCAEFVADLPARLSGDLGPAAADALARHLAGCAPCREEARRLEETWAALGDGADVEPSPRWAAETLGAMERAVLAQHHRDRERDRDRDRFRSAPFPLGAGGTAASRPAPRALLLAASLLVAAGLGWGAARWTAPSATGFPSAPSPRTAAAALTVVPVGAGRTLEASRAVPDFASRPVLSNVAFRTADGEGRLEVSFDVTSRWTFAGRPEEKGLADLLVYIASAPSSPVAARGRAVELVARHGGAGGAVPAAPEVVALLVKTLREDGNPGVRKKAAEALAQLPPSPPIRDAFAEVLRSERSPAIRMLAVDALGRSAREARDPVSVDALRERASDERENGYVRVRAAGALAGLPL